MRLSKWIVLPVFGAFATASIIPNSNRQYDAVADLSTLNGTQDADSALSELEYEYQKLELLKHQLFSLHHEVAKQEHEIFLILRKDFQTCQGVKCYVQTALQRAPDFFDLFKAHFRHPKNATSGWSCPWQSTTTTDTNQVSLGAESETVYNDDAEEAIIRVSGAAPSPTVTSLSYAVLPTRSVTAAYPPTVTTSFDANELPDFSSTSGPTLRTSAVATAHTALSTAANASKFGDFHLPNPAPRTKHYRLIVAATATVTSLLILALLIKGLHIFCANPRRRADIAARCEERRTRREYRRAAFKHHVRQIISRIQFWKAEENSLDYEEKREAILQDQHPQHVVGDRISSLQHAHEVVAQLLRAEEGRMSGQVHVSNCSRSARSIRTTTTLPPYEPNPPKYSQELGRNVQVVAGFPCSSTQPSEGSTSSASSSVLDDTDLCTESSVVDCRSRFSMDTDSTGPSL